MQQRNRIHPQSFIAAGLFGLALYFILSRAGQPLTQASDAVRGIWIGVCLGLELIGLIRLFNRTTRPKGA